MPNIYQLLNSRGGQGYISQLTHLGLWMSSKIPYSHLQTLLHTGYVPAPFPSPTQLNKHHRMKQHPLLCQYLYIMRNSFLISVLSSLTSLEFRISSGLYLPSQKISTPFHACCTGEHKNKINRQFYFLD